MVKRTFEVREYLYDELYQCEVFDSIVDAMQKRDFLKRICKDVKLFKVKTTIEEQEL